jgi:hypothetical protein
VFYWEEEAVSEEDILKLAKEDSGSVAESLDSSEEPEDVEWLQKMADNHPEGSTEHQLLAYTLRTQNYVNDRAVPRPDKLTEDDTWKVGYSLEEMEGARGWSLYKASKARREQFLNSMPVAESGATDGNGIRDIYLRNLRDMSRRGREFLKSNKKDLPQEKIVWTGTYRGNNTSSSST